MLKRAKVLQLIDDFAKDDVNRVGQIVRLVHFNQTKWDVLKIKLSAKRLSVEIRGFLTSYMALQQGNCSEFIK